MQDRVRQLAFYDTLTQLPNRRLLDDRLSQALTASKRRTSFGVIMFGDKETDTEALRNRVDRVMYRAKNAAVNSVVFECA